jgi:hypothetical protein
MRTDADAPRGAALAEWTTQINRVQEGLTALKSAASAVPSLEEDPARDLSGITLKDLSHFVSSSQPTLDQLTNGLLAARAVANRIRNGSASIVAIHKLPPDILRMIFVYATEMDELGESPHLYDMYFIGKNPFQDRSTICLVCHYWRDICMSTSQLWRLICLRAQQPADVISAWARQGAEFGLDIIIHEHDRWWTTKSPDPLLKPFKNWRTFTFSGSLGVPLGIVGPLLRDMEDVNNIVALNLNGGRSMEPAPAELNFIRPFWVGLRSLHSLSVHSRLVPWNLLGVGSVLKELHHLKVYTAPPNPAEAIDVIVMTLTNLVTLEIDELYDDDRNLDADRFNPISDVLDSGGPACFHPALIHLQLYAVSPKYACRIFVGMTAPNLADLDADRWLIPVMANVVGFAARSRKPLRNLKLRSWTEFAYEEAPPGAVAGVVGC